ncbi:HAUS augmin-like complex subunit 5 [Plakobranchus ocellatus]|uniref:HAUS augmin-like complex subunit 5 n=1 Tax=Plakobranchus ocellatus TaxID=259542 RepID=A0AAV4CLS7_9GAST|nr:HAUS augmin-like complex subunit 5 [Plakobranchus ocellatus]
MDDLHVRLRQWATEEMKFHASAMNSQSTFKLPSEEDFKFLCSGPLVEVWKYVIKHVKSLQNAKLVKGNIKLQRSLGSLSQQEGAAQPGESEEERERRQILTQRQLKLSRELQQTRAEVVQLHRELGHTMEESATAEHAYQSVCQRVRDLQRREALLQVVHSCATEAAARYTEYTERVDKCIDGIVNKKDNSQENFVSGLHTEEDEELETESCHMVRHACEDISKFIYNSLDTPADKGQLESLMLDVRDQVERAAAINSTQSLTSALAANTDRAAKTLRQKTSALDISKDAEEISFSYAPREGLQDLSRPLSATDTVRKLLLASSEDHVLRWFKEQEHKNEEWKLSSRQTETIGEINKLLHRLIGDHPTHLASAKGYVSACIHLAEERAVVPCLRKEAVRLIERIDQARQERQALQLKYAQIQDFQKLVGNKQVTISQLAKLNASAPDRLKSHKQQVETYLTSRSLATHLSEVQALPERLKGVLISELDAFLGLLLPCLLTVPIDRWVGAQMPDTAHVRTYHCSEIQNTEIMSGMRWKLLKS